MEERQAAGATATSPPCEEIRTGSAPATLARAIVDNLYTVQGRTPAHATTNDWYVAVAHTVRDRLLEHWVRTVTTRRHQPRIVGYLSAEFLPGPHLGNAMLNLGIDGPVREAAASLGIDLETLLEHEQEPGLGNGGLGRLAACFLDSLATLRIPAIGYGIRYEYGIFDQEIRGGWQREITDRWLALGNPWEICRPEITYPVSFGGRTEPYRDEAGQWRVRWLPARTVKGVAHDTPIPGYRVPVVALMRLWKSEAVHAFDFEAFNEGDYYGAVEEQVASETLTKVLYPNDEPAIGKRLRLTQQYFFVSCALQDMFRIHTLQGNRPEAFPEGFAVQLNDTHPALAVAELMRILVDEHRIGWERAWELTRRSLSYTNHTLLAEALETWPLPLFGELLPRHLELVFEINRRFLEGLRRQGMDDGRLARLSLIGEEGEKSVRMAHLATVGSHTVNGVAELHTALLRETVLQPFHALDPARIRNVTNGVTPRRWLALSNPGLAALLGEAIGDGWICRFEAEIGRLEPLAADAAFRERWRAVKRANKARLAALIGQRTGVQVSPESLFDVQVKRIHEYKRQHLNVLHVVTLYRRLRENPDLAVPPRTVLFGGKAAPGYRMAKLIIRLIHAVAETVNGDAATADRLRVAFFPDFNVKNGQWIYPAADLSEQISTAGKEASGTGNMKFSLNGALTIGTLDGANVEIRRAVGEENFFAFGLSAAEVMAIQAGGYDPRRFYEGDAELRGALEWIASGALSPAEPGLFRPLVEALVTRDEYLVLADYRAYLEAQEAAGRAYADPEAWTARSILNVARMGFFSSDRAIREYAERIWRVGGLAPEEKEGGTPER